MALHLDIHSPEQLHITARTHAAHPTAFMTVELLRSTKNVVGDSVSDYSRERITFFFESAAKASEFFRTALEKVAVERYETEPGASLQIPDDLDTTPAKVTE